MRVLSANSPAVAPEAQVAAQGHEERDASWRVRGGRVQMSGPLDATRALSFEDHC
jgi:hypothetical protein